MKLLLNIIRRVFGTNKLKNDISLLSNTVTTNYELLKENNAILRDIYKSQVFNSTICTSPWLNDKSFSPSGWAVDYALLYTLYRVLNDFKPKNIIEFGLGQSSKMIHQYTSFYKETNAITIEHNPVWIDFFKKTITMKHELNIQIFDLEKISYKGFETLSYKNFNNNFIDSKFNFILVDAPFGSENYSRSQVLSLLPNSIDTSFCIIIDDYNRKGERETGEEIFKILKESNTPFSSMVYSGSKEHLLVCSEDLNFLTSF